MAWMTSRDLTNFRADVAKLLPDTAIIQSGTITISANGNPIETWSNAGTVACRLDPVDRTSEMIEYDLARELTVQEYQLTVPHDAALTRASRVQINSNIYEVVRIDDGHSHRVSRRALVHYVGIASGALTQLLDPSTLTSPVFAYSAHEDDSGLLFQDAAKAVAADADSDPVYTAVQVSGFGAVDGVQATSASRPLLRTGANGINGHNALSFDGTDDFFDIKGISAASGAKTFYIVHDPTAAVGTLEYLFDTLTGRLIITHLNITAGQVGYHDGAFHNIAAATTAAQIMCYALGSGTGTLYRNGSSIGSDTYTDKAITGLAASALGSIYNGTGSYYDGLIGAIYCYNALHSASERSQMLAYLSQQWDITVS